MTQSAPGRFYAADGACLRYRDEGDGPAVLLIHGWTLDLDMWEPQAIALRAGFRVIRFDRRGFGLSSGSPSVELDVLDVAALCAHLGLPRVTLVGMSQGARVALGAAGAWPALVSGLVLDGAPSIDPADAAERARELPFEHYRALAQAAGMEAFRREWSRHPLATLRTGRLETRELVATLIARYPGRDLLAPSGASVAAPPPARPVTLASIGQPALIIHGQFDLETRRRWAAHYQRQLPRARSAQIDDAGHLCNLDNPVEYSRILQDFLQENAT